ncbi:hypothetical protein CEXT_537471 [Caerostris extrusa]|uniref:Uncharacterized protein n=1 Tax=Caerostris extrusa TaxID=172846 RepID=A0AAV4QJK5_CAEEX|nr:hypothetical protein CEXT_537471 [Caerostris extrusa]
MFPQSLFFGIGKLYKAKGIEAFFAVLVNAFADHYLSAPYHSKNNTFPSRKYVGLYHYYYNVRIIYHISAFLSGSTRSRARSHGAVWASACTFVHVKEAQVPNVVLLLPIPNKCFNLRCYQTVSTPALLPTSDLNRKNGRKRERSLLSHMGHPAGQMSSSVNSDLSQQLIITES